MSKFIILHSIIIGMLFSCETRNAHPDFVVISGTLSNTKSKEIRLGQGSFNKSIVITANGAFRDTISVKAGIYSFMLFDDHVLSQIYLKNGSDILVSANLENYNKTLNFQEDFADYNNYLHQKAIVNKSDLGLNKSMYRYQKTDFDSLINAYENKLASLLKLYPNISKEQLEKEDQLITSRVKKFVDKYEKQYSQFENLAKNMESPVFENYKNYNGGTTSLSDLKGKYVFIDIWATWCVPCKAQIPYLKEFEKKYHDKNIEFVSISVDFPKDYEKWKKNVADLDLTGTQLFAPNAFESEFIQQYSIKAIPRFVFINPEGKIVDYDAPKPSKKQDLTDLFNSENI